MTALTSKDGRFSVRVPGDQGLKLVATHPDHGEKQRTELPPGVRDVTIRFENQGKLMLELEAAPKEAVARSGPIEYLVVDRKREHVIRDHLWGSPTPVGSVPEGNYNVFVFWPGMDVFGGTPVTVEAGETAHCHVQLLPAEWLEGRIVDSSGTRVSGATVQLDSEPWLIGASQAWGRATSDSDGFFRLLLGRKTSFLDLQVSTADGRKASWSGAEGPALVVIEDE